MVHVERVHRQSGEVTVDVREHETDLVVKARREVAERIILLDLGATDGAALPTWSAGGHIDLLLGNDLVRQYSLCGDPNDRMTWKTAVLLESESRGGSSFIDAHLVPGASVRARGPRNHFELRASRHYVFIAGGIGITPILPMAMAAEAAGAAWTLAYAGRRRTSMAFLDDLQRYGDHVTIYSGEEGQRIHLAALLGHAAADTLIYCCGPERLLSGVEVEAAHWAPGAIHVERFIPKSVGAPVWSREFEIELRQSGKILTVRPDQSILKVVESAGIEVLCSCCEGTCGSCETVVLEGAIDHRDSVLTDYEKESGRCMMICCSRAAGPKLVLDL